MSPRELHVFLLLLVINNLFVNGNTLNAVANVSSKLFEKFDNSKGFIEMAAENGYQAEAHDVTTEDGYILTMHRIPAADNCPERYPVLIMHGLLQASESWLDSGPQAPGYLISDECYDVWFGNVRGNYNARRHITLNPDTDLAFWKFSVDEMGLYDVPAMIHYVLETTNSEKLIYIGFSQGGGIFLVTNSEKPQYADKVSLYVGLSPGTRQLFTKSVPYRLFTEAIKSSQAVLEDLGVWEILSKGFPVQGALGFLCQVELVAAVVCGLAVSTIDSPHPGSLTPDIEKRLFQHAPAGTSVQNLARHGQAMTSEKFVKFDYGVLGNFKKYGCVTPPEYDIGATKSPALILHGPSDHLVGTKDADWVVSQLPNVLVIGGGQIYSYIYATW